MNEELADTQYFTEVVQSLLMLITWRIHAPCVATKRFMSENNMGSKTIIKKTRFGNVLAKGKNETIKSLARRQHKEFVKAQSEKKHKDKEDGE